jgi:hypothetical protein
MPFLHETQAKIETEFGNELRKSLGRPAFEDVTVVFNDYVDGKSLNNLWAWRRVCYDPVTGKIGLNSRAKLPFITGMECGPDGTMQRSWKWVGCLNLGVNGGEGGMDKANAQNRVSLTFCFDYIQHITLLGSANAGQA